MKSRWLLSIALASLLVSGLAVAGEEVDSDLKLKLIEPGPKIRKELKEMPLPRPEIPDAEVLSGEESRLKEEEEKVIVVGGEKEEVQKTSPEKTKAEPEKAEFEPKAAETEPKEAETELREMAQVDCKKLPSIKVGPYRPQPEIERSLYEVFSDLKRSLLESKEALSDLVSVRRIFRSIDEKKKVDAYSLTEMLSELLAARDTETAQKIVCTAVSAAAEKVNFTPAVAAHFFYELSRFYENSEKDLSFQAAVLALSYEEDSDYYEQLIKLAKEQSRLKEGSRAVVEYIKFLKLKFPSIALKKAAELYEDWSETEPAGEFLENLLRSARQ